MPEVKAVGKAGNAPCPWGSTGMVGEPAFSDRCARPAVRLLGAAFRATCLATRKGTLVDNVRQLLWSSWQTETERGNEIKSELERKLETKKKETKNGRKIIIIIIIIY